MTNKLDVQVPTRFLALCYFCQRELDTRSDEVYQNMKGWLCSDGGDEFFTLPVPEKGLLPSLCRTAYERRRDLARFDGSHDRASMMFQPCFLAVEKKERMSAKSIAPCNDRKPPEIF